jgi:hypothetical protein
MILQRPVSKNEECPWLQFGIISSASGNINSQILLCACSLTSSTLNLIRISLIQQDAMERVSRMFTPD